MLDIRCPVWHRDVGQEKISVYVREEHARTTNRWMPVGRNGKKRAREEGDGVAEIRAVGGKEFATTNGEGPH